MAMGRGTRVLHNLGSLNATNPGSSVNTNLGGPPERPAPPGQAAVTAAGHAGGQQQPYSVIIEQRGKNEVLLMENHAIVALCKSVSLHKYVIIFFQMCGSIYVYLLQLQWNLSRCGRNIPKLSTHMVVWAYSE